MPLKGEFAVKKTFMRIISKRRTEKTELYKRARNEFSLIPWYKVLNLVENTSSVSLAWFFRRKKELQIGQMTRTAMTRE